MEFTENNISTIVSMIVPFISYLIATFCGFNINEALLTMFLTGVVELVILIWSARNPNTMRIFGNAKPVTAEADEGILNEEYVTGDEQ